jgi:hypothetical protein
MEARQDVRAGADLANQNIISDMYGRRENLQTSLPGLQSGLTSQAAGTAYQGATSGSAVMSPFLSQLKEEQAQSQLTKERNLDRILKAKESDLQKKIDLATLKANLYGQHMGTLAEIGPDQYSGISVPSYK